MRKFLSSLTLFCICILFSLPSISQGAGFIKCADENGSYYFNTKVDVAYGGGGLFVYKYGITGQVNFNNATFGDPAVGVYKAGYYRASQTTIQPVNPSIVIPDDEDGVNPVSPNDMKMVMKWIAENVADSKIEYCYKQSYGRGVGEPLSGCPPGSEQNGALCYPLCAAGYRGEGPVCWQTSCPPGYRNDPAHCAKPAAYGRGGGYPWKFGDGFNLDGARSRCKRDNPQGCEQWGEIIYPSCAEGFKAFACCVCTPVCPNGMRDIGVSCEKKSYGRGAGYSMGCRGGFVQDGGLCYTACRPGYYGVGPVCWQSCTGNQPVDCAAACAKSQTACATKTIDQVTAVAMLVANILSLGSTAEFTVAKSAAKTAIKAGDKIAAKAAMKTCVKELAKGLENLTTKEVVRKLKEKFQENAMKWVAKEYAKVQMKIAMQNEFSVEDLRDLAGLDPTGVADVVNAFWQPICAKAPVFPNLSRGY